MFNGNGTRIHTKGSKFSKAKKGYLSNQNDSNDYIARNTIELKKSSIQQLKSFI